MPRSRVLSFMSQWGGPRSPTSESPPSPTKPKPAPSPSDNAPPFDGMRKPLNLDTAVPHSQASNYDEYVKISPQSPFTPSRARGESRIATRPNSMVQTYQPPQVDVAPDTPPELQPIFSFLNSHSNKLYQEGYFLKLHDLDSRGRPSSDRAWLECFAQLVGTVLSLWDAAALDMAGEDGEVVPTFINLSDASIKMIESLPMNGAQGGSLQNVLSISTAANNRYLLHFNSLNSLTQWTAGIRLAMFEHSTLQEAYTGSLIAGKGRFLNNIKAIMDRSRFAHEDWARVRFGAGTPWKRCWCVTSPPDEKEYKKAQKTLTKSSAYEKTRVPKGDIRFYDTRKVTKKTRPIATVTDAYAAYAIYPQSKPLIDQSTLVKLEGLVTIHSSPETTTEGFVFVMPEVHPAVTGFEMMLRFLFPVFDSFGLYGRPNRLIADTLDQRGLMFAMPKDRRYGYLDTLDVSGLIHTQGSQTWTERQWRRELKKLTAARMMTQLEGGPPQSRAGSQRRNTTSRNSLPPTRGSVRFEDGAPGTIHSSPASRSASPVHTAGPGSRFPPPKRTDSAPPTTANVSPHKRSVSDARGYNKYMTETPSRLSYEASRPDEDTFAPAPPAHGGAFGNARARAHGPGSLERIQSGPEVRTIGSVFHDLQTQNATSPPLPPPEPVLSPPAFTHNPNSRPANQPYQAPELRRAHSEVDAATLYQMQDAVRRGDTPEEEWSNALPHRDGVGGNQYSQHTPYPPSQQTVPSNALTNRNLNLPTDRSAGMVSGSGAVAMKPNADRDPQQRLSTIPGSPPMDGDGEGFQTVEAAYGLTGRRVDGMDGRTREMEIETEDAAVRPAKSVARKPVPPKLQEPQPEAKRSVLSEPSSPASAVSNLEDAYIDHDALDRILNDSPGRNNTMQSNASSATPDYASTASASTHKSKKSVEKPRTGQLKTVGDPEYKDDKRRSYGAGKLDSWEADLAADGAEVPNIDFGPTFSYKPKSRPGTSGTITAGQISDRSRSRSGDRLRNRSQEGLGGTMLSNHRMSPAETHRLSYFGGHKTPSPNAVTPLPGPAVEALNTPGDRTSVAWQPGVATAGGSPGIQQNRQSLTPEQWVQYRAAQAAQPQQPPPRRPTSAFAHQRTASGASANQLRTSLTKTPPPLCRTPSGGWTQHAQQRTPPSRPLSRGASVYLNQPRPGGGGMASSSANLTAKEQMHVARATGTPLLNYTSSAQKKQAEEQTPGLFGALAAREREKEESKKAGGKNGIGNPIVQQAIATRQQQQYQAEAEAQAQAQYEMQMRRQATQQAQLASFQQQQAQMQEQLNYQSLMLAQGEQPGVHRQNSWQQQQQVTGRMSPGSQYGPAPASSFTSQFAQRQWESQQMMLKQQQQQQQQQRNGEQQWQPQRR